MNKIDDIDYLRYIVPGLAMTTALFTAFFETSYHFYIRLTFDCIYKAMLTTPIGRAEIICGELIWVSLKGAVMSTIVAFIFTLFGLANFSGLFAVPFLGGLVGLACGAIGLITSAMVKTIDQFQLVYSLIISPMFFFSGAFYPVHKFELWGQVIAFLSPLYNGVRIAQESFWQRGEVLTVLIKNGLPLLALAVLFTFIGAKKVYSKIT